MMPKTRKIYLVSCVSRKKSKPAPAVDLYTSAWFSLARNLVKETGSPWFILSARHGLLDPNKRTAPYNETLNTMGAAKRRAWAERVKAQMESHLPDAEEIVIFAGERYRENLMPYLCNRFGKVAIPMKGLGIGKQLQWMKHAAENK